MTKNLLLNKYKQCTGAVTTQFKMKGRLVVGIFSKFPAQSRKALSAFMIGLIAAQSVFLTSPAPAARTETPPAPIKATKAQERRFRQELLQEQMEARLTQANGEGFAMSSPRLPVMARMQAWIMGIQFRGTKTGDEAWMDNFAEFGFDDIKGSWKAIESDVQVELKRLQEEIALLEARQEAYQKSKPRDSWTQDDVRALMSLQNAAAADFSRAMVYLLMVVKARSISGTPVDPNAPRFLDGSTLGFQLSAETFQKMMAHYNPRVNSLITPQGIKAGIAKKIGADVFTLVSQGSGYAFVPKDDIVMDIQSMVGMTRPDETTVTRWAKSIIIQTIASNALVQASILSWKDLNETEAAIRAIGPALGDTTELESLMDTLRGQWIQKAWLEGVQTRLKASIRGLLLSRDEAVVKGIAKDPKTAKDVQAALEATDENWSAKLVGDTLDQIPPELYKGGADTLLSARLKALLAQNYQGLYLANIDALAPDKATRQKLAPLPYIAGGPYTVEVDPKTKEEAFSLNEAWLNAKAPQLEKIDWAAILAPFKDEKGALVTFESSTLSRAAVEAERETLSKDTKEWAEKLYPLWKVVRPLTIDLEFRRGALPTSFTDLPVNLSILRKSLIPALGQGGLSPLAMTELERAGAFPSDEAAPEQMPDGSVLMPFQKAKMAWNQAIKDWAKNTAGQEPGKNGRIKSSYFKVHVKEAVKNAAALKNFTSVFGFDQESEDFPKLSSLTKLTEEQKRTYANDWLKYQFHKRTLLYPDATDKEMGNYLEKMALTKDQATITKLFTDGLKLKLSASMKVLTEFAGAKGDDKVLDLILQSQTINDHLAMRLPGILPLIDSMRDEWTLAKEDRSVWEQVSEVYGSPMHYFMTIMFTDMFFKWGTGLSRFGYSMGMGAERAWVANGIRGLTMASEAITASHKALGAHFGRYFNSFMGFMVYDIGKRYSRYQRIKSDHDSLQNAFLSQTNRTMLLSTEQLEHSDDLVDAQFTQLMVWDFGFNMFFFFGGGVGDSVMRFFSSGAERRSMADFKLLGVSPVNAMKDPMLWKPENIESLASERVKLANSMEISEQVKFDFGKQVENAKQRLLKRVARDQRTYKIMRSALQMDFENLGFKKGKETFDLAKIKSAMDYSSGKFVEYFAANQIKPKDSPKIKRAKRENIRQLELDQQRMLHSYARLMTFAMENREVLSTGVFRKAYYLGKASKADFFRNVDEAVEYKLRADHESELLSTLRYKRVNLQFGFDVPAKDLSGEITDMPAEFAEQKFPTDPERNYFRDLGIKPDASAEQIKEGYLKVSADILASLKSAEPAVRDSAYDFRMRNPNEAFAVLQDPEKATIYLRFLTWKAARGEAPSSYLDDIHVKRQAPVNEADKKATADLKPVAQPAGFNPAIDYFRILGVTPSTSRFEMGIRLMERHHEYSQMPYPSMRLKLLEIVEAHRVLTDPLLSIEYMVARPDLVDRYGGLPGEKGPE